MKAITAHKTDREVSGYTAATDQVRLSDQAMEALAASPKAIPRLNMRPGLRESRDFHPQRQNFYA